MNTVESECYLDPVAVGDLFDSLAFKLFFHEIQNQAGPPCPLTTTTKANSLHFVS